MGKGVRHAVIPCIVCRRDGGEATVLNGVKVIICEACQADDFRIREAIRRSGGRS